MELKIGTHNQLILDTLFVILVKPSRNVEIERFPLNTVPIPYSVKDIVCTLPSDQSIRIRCKQVHVLPNFAMTDYAS